MALEGTYEPSPWEPIAEQVALFESTDGADGNLLEGKPCIILWTRGRKTGTVRKTPLMRVTDDAGRYAVVASMGGAPNHPVWYLNLLAQPRATIDAGPERIEVTASTAAGEERTRLWNEAVRGNSQFAVYKSITSREIPVVVLTPVA